MSVKDIFIWGFAVLYSFMVGDLEIGLDPNGHKEGVTAYFSQMRLP